MIGHKSNYNFSDLLKTGFILSFLADTISTMEFLVKRDVLNDNQKNNNLLKPMDDFAFANANCAAA